MKASKWMAEIFQNSSLPHWLCYGILLLCGSYSYLVFVLSISPDRPPILMFAFYWLLFIWGVAWFWGKLKEVEVKGLPSSELRPMVVAVGITVFYWVMILGCGIITSPDTKNQWRQVLATHFNDWHPIIHTLSIWLVAQVVESQIFVNMVQCLVFGLLCGWLCRTLQLYHYRKWVVYGVMAFVCFSPMNFIYFRVLWKDVAFALASFALAIMLIHLWHTRGLWLLKPWRIVLFLIVITLASFYRHNGIFLTLPLCCFLPFLYDGWKKKVLSIGVVLLAFGCIGGYIVVRQKLVKSNAIEIVSHQNFSETVGLPMSMMGEAFVLHPEQVPDEAKEFLLSMGSEDEWRENWDGDFNSVRFYFGRMSATDGRASSGVVLGELGPKKFFPLFLKTCVSAPKSAIKAFLHVTSLAWSPIPKHMAVMLPGTGKLMNNEINFPFRASLHFQPLNWLVGAPGMHILLIILFGGIAFVRFGWRSCILSVPFISYTFGTALLLTGHDHRFFFVLSLCVAPILCLCLTRPQK